MKSKRLCIFLTLGLLCFALVDGKGRGGGGGRGGGSRGSSSRGSSSRGSSSRGTSSSSTSTSSRGTTLDRTRSNGQSESKPKITPSAPKPETDSTHVKPSAPEFRDTRPNPSAPRPADNYNQPGQNPNYRPGGGQPGVNQQNPPPYPGPQARPPPYDTQPMPPGPGFKPGVQPGMGNPSGNPPPYPGAGNYPQGGTGVQPYPRQPGPGGVQPYPQQPGLGNPPPYPGAGHPYPGPGGVGSQPYPRQPGMGNQPYPQQPGSGYQPYPRQPGGYPQQSGGMYGNAPPYAQHSGFPLGGNAYAKPYKKKGLLGQIFSGKSSKQPKYGAYGSSYGKYGASSGMSKAMYPMMPMMMMARKPSFSSGFGRPSFMFLPIFLPHSHHHYGSYHYGDINDAGYRGGCRKPFKPNNSTMDCDTTRQGATCKLQCNEGYHFKDNVTTIENKCWHMSGVWRPNKTFPECLPSCGEKCRNNAKCIRPGVCVCDAEYRGENCEHHVLSCDVRKLANGSSHKIGWVCQHARNETICKVRCRPNSHFADEPQSREYKCTISGEWTPSSIPDCISDGNNSTSLLSNVTSTIIPLLLDKNSTVSTPITNENSSTPAPNV